MQTYSQPLIELQTEVSRFLRDTSLKLLHVVTDVELHGAVVELLAGQELRLDNRRPFVVLEEPHAKNDPGWERRTYTAWRQHERRRVEMAENGETLGCLPEPVATKGLPGLVELLGQLLLVRPEDTEGLVVLLAPAYVEAPELWQEAIGVLLSIKGLGAARFMVVERERCTITAVLVANEARARSTVCRVTGESPKAVLAGALDEEVLRFGGLVGARPKGVAPPRRAKDSPATAADPSAVQQLVAARDVLLASVAMDEGRTSDAIAHQRRARDASVGAGRAEQGVMMELVLGSYLAAAGACDRAEESYQRAANAAEAAGLLDRAAMAHLALGGSRASRRDAHGALVAYAKASTTAERAGQGALAVRACGLTGDLAYELRMEPQAIAFWSKAIEIAERDPATAPMTTAGLSALNLALLCRERGRHHHAAQLLAKAEALTGLDPERLQPEPAPFAHIVQVAQGPANAPLFQRSGSTQPLAPTPSLAARPEPPGPMLEDTEQLTPAEIAALHWPVPPLAPEESWAPERVHEWSEAEQESLRLATAEVITEDTTELLSQDELRAIRGDVDPPPPGPLPSSGGLSSTAIASSPDGLEDLRLAASTVVSSEIAGVGDETEFISLERIRALAAEWAKRTHQDMNPRVEPRHDTDEEER